MDFFTDLPYNPRIKNVHELYIPDGIIMNGDLSNYSGLKKISVSVKDYRPIELFDPMGKGKEVLRMPLQGKIIRSKEIQQVIDCVTALYAKAQDKVHSLFFVYDLASRAWYEELTLLCLIHPGLEDGQFTIDEIKGCVPNKTVRHAAEVLTAEHENIYELAEIIEGDLLLSDYYTLYNMVNKEYGLACNEDLNTALNNIEKYTVDLGQRFDVKVGVQGSVLHGFDGSGRLTGCRYKITGFSTYEMNQEIIRLTSVHYEVPEKYTYNDMVVFSFLAQRWYDRDGKIGGLWSYPDGTIYDEGIVGNHETVTSILLELCFLAKNFRGLSMNVDIWASNAVYIQSGKKVRQLEFSVHNGEVGVHFTSGGNPTGTLDTIPCCKVDYQGMQRKGMKLLADDYLRQIVYRNKKEDESEENISKSVVYEIGEYRLWSILTGYLHKKYGWRIKKREDYYDMSETYLLASLFTFDADKVNRYLEEIKENSIV